MKNIIFTLLLLVSFSTLHAQTLIVDNQSGCDIDVNALFADQPGACGTTYSYMPTPPLPVTVLAGNSYTFDISTTTAADWSPTWPSPFPTGMDEWREIVVCEPCSGNCVTVNDPCLGSPGGTVIPTCGLCAGTSINVTWTSLGGGNALVTIN